MEVKPGWEKKKRDSMLTPGVTEVAYYKSVENGPLWTVVADHIGVEIRGTSPKFTEHSQLESFAWVISDAMREHLKLKKARLVLPQ